MDRLEAPRELAVLDVQGDDRVGPEVVAGAATVPRHRVARDHVEQAEVRVDGRADPDRAAAVHVAVGRPAARADLAGAGSDVPAPHLESGHRVERDHERASARVPARGALEHQRPHAREVDVDGRRGEAVALADEADLVAPDDGPGGRVQGHDAAIPLPGIDQAVADRETAVGSDERLREARVVLPQKVAVGAVEGVHVAQPVGHVEHAVVGDRVALLRLQPLQLLRDSEMGLPGGCQRADIRRIDVGERRVTIVLQAAARRQPVVAGARVQVGDAEVGYAGSRGALFRIGRSAGGGNQQRRARNQPDGEKRDRPTDDLSSTCHALS